VGSANHPLAVIASRKMFDNGAGFREKGRNSAAAIDRRVPIFVFFPTRVDHQAAAWIVSGLSGIAV
jgi:hypothetical protein